MTLFPKTGAFADSHASSQRILCHHNSYFVNRLDYHIVETPCGKTGELGRCMCVGVALIDFPTIDTFGDRGL
jgi:hypothetical protein